MDRLSTFDVPSNKSMFKPNTEYLPSNNEFTNRVLGYLQNEIVLTNRISSKSRAVKFSILVRKKTRTLAPQESLPF